MIKKIFNRILLCYKIFKSFKPLNFKAWFALLFSLITEAIYSFLTSLLKLHISNPRLWPRGTLPFRLRDGSIVLLRGGTEDIYNMLPFREDDVDQFIRKNLCEGDVFVDVGANVGYYTLLASKLVGKSGRVIAVEPVPQTVAILKKNIRLNCDRNVVVIDKAAWSSKMKIQMSIPKGFYGQASAVGLHKSSAFYKLDVETVSMDEITKKFRIRTIKILKIDVEGSELQVLCGAKKTLEKTKYVIIELSNNIHAILELLRQASFKTRKFKFATYILAYRARARNV